MPNTRSNGTEVRQTIVKTLDAPRLTGISTEDFVTFKQKRDVYERRVQEKSQEQRVTIPTTTYFNSIDKSVFEVLVLAKWVTVDEVENITEGRLKSCVEKRGGIKPEDYDLAQVEKGIEDVKMDRSMPTLELQVWTLGLRYSQKLEGLGYSKFIEAHCGITGSRR